MVGRCAAQRDRGGIRLCLSPAMQRYCPIACDVCVPCVGHPLRTVYASILSKMRDPPRAAQRDLANVSEGKLQGFLETSNVNAVSEVSELISAQRAYEMNSKVIQASDEMMGTLNQIK